MARNVMSQNDNQGGAGNQPVQKVWAVTTPDAFNGELSWDEWIGHFESVAHVNDWDDATRLLWLEVRMIGKAQSVWRRISTEAKASYGTVKAALRKRFEPDSRRNLYVVEFQTRKRGSGEAWEELADALRLLADKAFHLQDEAKKQLSLDRFLALLGKPELALAVKQKRPKSIDKAVAYTIEMESYMMTTGSTRPAAAVTIVIPEQEVDTPGIQLPSETTISVAAVLRKQDAMMDMLRNFNIHLEHAERIVASGEKSHAYQSPSKKPLEQPRQPIVCRKCGQEGHFARGCAQRKEGND